MASHSQSDLRQRCADAALVALKATEVAWTAFYTADVLLDRLNVQARNIQAASDAMRQTKVQLRNALRDLNILANGYIDVITAPDDGS